MLVTNCLSQASHGMAWKTIHTHTHTHRQTEWKCLKAVSHTQFLITESLRLVRCHLVSVTTQYRPTSSKDTPQHYYIHKQVCSHFLVTCKIIEYVSFKHILLPFRELQYSSALICPHVSTLIMKVLILWMCTQRVWLEWTASQLPNWTVCIMKSSHPSAFLYHPFHHIHTLPINSQPHYIPVLQ